MGFQRPTQFSLRRLLGAITLAGGLLGLWNLSSQRAVSDVQSASGGWKPTIIAPYLLRIRKSDNITVVETYHLWCLGLVCDLPLKRQFPETSGIILTVRPHIIIQPEEELNPTPFSVER